MFIHANNIVSRFEHLFLLTRNNNKPNFTLIYFQFACHTPIFPTMNVLIGTTFHLTKRT